MNLSVHHVAVIVSDYAAAKHFYVDLLGLPVVRENCRGNGLWKLDLRLGDGELEIFNAHEPPARLSYPEAAGLRHLAFRVDSVAEAVAELAAKGIACEPVRMDEYSRKPFTFFVTRTACRWSCTSDALRWKFLLILYEAAHGRTPCLCAAVFAPQNLKNNLYKSVDKLLYLIYNKFTLKAWRCRTLSKSVYSVVLMDDVVDAVDRLAYEAGTNRSNMINRILAEYVQLATPEQRMQDIFLPSWMLSAGRMRFSLC